MARTRTIHGASDKGPVAARDLGDALVLPDVQLVVVRRAAVVLERLGAGRLLSEGRHGEFADLEQFGRGEEHHIGGVVVERIDDAALFEENGVEPAPLQLDPAGQSGRTGADNNHVKFAHSIAST